MEKDRNIALRYLEIAARWYVFITLSIYGYAKLFGMQFYRPGKMPPEVAAKTAAEQRAQQVEEEFTSFKTDLEALREAAERKDERLAKVKEVAAHLGDDFFADSKRIERIVAMDEEGFEGYLADLKHVAPTEVPVVPRETAMDGAPAAGTTKESAARALFLGRFTPAKEG